MSVETIEREAVSVGNQQADQRSASIGTLPDDFLSPEPPAAARPSSARKVQANRANGAMSQGPVTEAGRQRSARNNTRHGIFCKQVVLDCEDRGDFDEFSAAMREQFDPYGPMEEMLADRIVAEGWRLQRVLRIEREIMDARLTDLQDRFDKTDNCLAGVAPRIAKLGPSIRFDFQDTTFERLRLYESRIERSLYKAMSELEKIQAPRRVLDGRRREALHARVEGIREAMRQVYQNIRDRQEYLVDVAAGIEEAHTPSPNESPEETQRRQAWIATARRQRADADHTLGTMKQQYARLGRRLAEQEELLASDLAAHPWPSPFVGEVEEAVRTVSAELVGEVK